MEATNWQPQRLTKKISLVGRRNPKKSTKDIKRQAQTGPPSGKSLVNAPKTTVILTMDQYLLIPFLVG